MTHNDSYGWRVFWGYIFLFFLGGFGVHRFYLGRTTSGIVYACTMGLCGLGILFDFFAMPFLCAEQV